ncbi:MAG: PEP-CTERM sorting domain-containing protein [Deltaproteobacteria bacterium]|jgi:hypothetical protein|nr:PEP-CTERM sorting domain-containing protein [Deltaproteobacteria bacterium]
MKKLVVVLMGLFLISMGSINSADAVAVLTIDDGVNAPIIVNDSDGDGFVSYAGSLGSFSLVFTGGVTKPLSGTATSPVLDLVGQLVSTAPGSLMINFMDYGFGPVPGSSLTSLVAGGFISGGGSMTFETLINGTAITTIGPLSGGAFSDMASGTITAASPFSIGLTANVIHTGSGTSSFDTGVVVPEPGTLAMVGFGLVGLYYVRRSKTFKI